MPCQGLEFMGGGSRELPMTSNKSRETRRAISHPGRLDGIAVLVSTVAQIGGRDYSLVGEATKEEIGKFRYVGRLREWAVVAAVIFAVFAALSWTSLLYFLVFLGAAVALALLAVIAHFARPVVEVEERETKTGDSRRRETKYPPP
jgi:small-conductance mechanosensitive channel